MDMTRKEAEELVRRHEISSLPINPMELADKEDVMVMPMPSSRPGGVSGMLQRHSGVYSGVHAESFGILYATHVDNAGFQRFSVAHELGHLFLPGHQEAMQQGILPPSRAEFSSRDRYEREADSFASNLLMPVRLFDKQMRTAGEGLEAIRALREVCCTSLTATAIRYVERTSDLVAIVLSENGIIKYANASRFFKEYPGIRFPMSGSILPSHDVRSFCSEQHRTRHALSSEKHVEVSDWFDSVLNGELLEECVGLGGWGRTLTVISALDFPMIDEFDESTERGGS